MLVLMKIFFAAVLATMLATCKHCSWWLDANTVNPEGQTALALGAVQRSRSA
jgi:hypothetical protein